ncbi:MAG: hypothetical protein KAH22_07750 [Thiotrichaceae bacterium]|nr:hypothetical protein [Thiotrichaceae bacterium]
MSQKFIIITGLLVIALVITFYINNKSKNDTVSVNDIAENNENESVAIENTSEELFLLKSSISDAVDGAIQDDIQRAVEQQISK